MIMNGHASSSPWEEHAQSGSDDSLLSNSENIEAHHNYERFNHPILDKVDSKWDSATTATANIITGGINTVKSVWKGEDTIQNVLQSSFWFIKSKLKSLQVYEAYSSRYAIQLLNII